MKLGDAIRGEGVAEQKRWKKQELIDSLTGEFKRLTWLGQSYVSCGDGKSR